MRIFPTSVVALSLFLAAPFLAAPAHAKLDKETGDQIQQVLERGTRSGDRLARALAVEAFGMLRPAENRATTLDALKDPIWEVQAGAIRALLSTKDKDPAWRDVLKNGLTNPRLDLGRDVMPILAKLSDKDAVALGLEVVHDDKAPTKNDLIAAFGKAGPVRMTAFFKALLADKNPSLVEGVANYVTTLRTPDALPLYELVLKVGSDDAKKRAFEGLAKMPPGTKLALLKPFLKSKDPDVSVRVAEVLAWHGDRAAAEGLLPLLQSKDDKQLVRALDALATIAHPGLFAAVDPLLKQPTVSAEVVGRVLEIHLRAKDGKLVDLVKPLRKNDSVKIQAIAVYYLGVAEKGRALPMLHEDLFHGDPNVRLASVRAVGDIGSKESIPHLARALDNSREPDIRAAIVKALANIKDKDIVPIVSFLITDPTPEVRKWAIIGLVRVNHKDAVSSLKIALSDSDIESRTEAVKAILSLDPVEGPGTFRMALGWLPPEKLVEIDAIVKEGFVPYLDMCLTSERPEIRAAAMRLLEKYPKHETKVLEIALDRTKDTSLKIAILERLVKLNGKDELVRLQKFCEGGEVSLRSAALRLAAATKAPDADVILRKSLFEADELPRVTGALGLLDLHEWKIDPKPAKKPTK